MTNPTAMPAADAPLVETEALTLRAAGHTLLYELTWQARAGERWCVIGRNAAGKSTLLRALAGLGVPGRDGEVRWLGRRQDDWAAADAACVRAYAPQQAVDRFQISVQRLLELCAVRGDEPQRAAEVLAALDAQRLARRGVMQLSGGERQRVALAQCALQGAPLMLMDEPVSFQDPAHQILVSRWLAQLVAPGGAAALVVTAHDVNWIARTATHVLALYDEGRWRAGPAATLLDAALLAQVYGCGWTEVGGVWVAN